MTIYLVGGAVRDKLLNYPFHEKDWVVVGATPDDMLSQGYTPVGKDFPVFLHPKTKEEYALARTERKTAPGYTGFDVHSAPNVTLEDDLRRRDLTINAIAEDANGNLIDPYDGQQDIKDKILRHVSAAFAEDPVRILRVARFAARYQHLGFTIAEETTALMQSMVDSGEVDHLIPERVWKEMSRGLNEKTPEAFIRALRHCGALQKIMPELDTLFGIPQPPKHHPEIDCGEHSLLCLRQAAQLSDNNSVRFASLMHDLGKGTTPKDVLPKHIGHESRGVDLIQHYCERLTVPKEQRDLAILASRFHTHCHRAFELKASTLLKTLQELDAFRRPERFEHFLLCCIADTRGRTSFENAPYPQADYFRQALAVCQSIENKGIISDGFRGKKIGEELQNRRLNALQKLKQQTAEKDHNDEH